MSELNYISTNFYAFFNHITEINAEKHGYKRIKLDLDLLYLDPRLIFLKVF
jgi:hypothetical protein